MEPRTALITGPPKEKTRAGTKKGSTQRIQTGKSVLLLQVLGAILKSVAMWLLVFSSSVCQSTASNGGEGINEKRPHLAYTII